MKEKTTMWIPQEVDSQCKGCYFWILWWFSLVLGFTRQCFQREKKNSLKKIPTQKWEDYSVNPFVSIYILLYFIVIYLFGSITWRKCLISKLCSLINSNQSLPSFFPLHFFLLILGICNSSPPNKPADSVQSNCSSSFLNFGMCVIFKKMFIL